jgi:hypothetical protein
VVSSFVGNIGVGAVVDAVSTGIVVVFKVDSLDDVSGIVDIKTGEVG